MLVDEVITEVVATNGNPLRNLNPALVTQANTDLAFVERLELNHELSGYALLSEHAEQVKTSEHSKRTNVIEPINVFLNNNWDINDGLTNMTKQAILATTNRALKHVNGLEPILSIQCENSWNNSNIVMNQQQDTQYHFDANGGSNNKQLGDVNPPSVPKINKTALVRSAIVGVLNGADAVVTPVINAQTNKVVENKNNYLTLMEMQSIEIFKKFNNLFLTLKSGVANIQFNWIKFVNYWFVST